MAFLLTVSFSCVLCICLSVDSHLHCTSLESTLRIGFPLDLGILGCLLFMDGSDLTWPTALYDSDLFLVCQPKMQKVEDEVRYV